MIGWPSRRMLLWHPESPGVRIHVLVRWPRYLWVKGPDDNGPRSIATVGETLRRYRELRRIAAARAARR